MDTYNMRKSKNYILPDFENIDIKTFLERTFERETIQNRKRPSQSQIEVTDTREIISCPVYRGVEIIGYTKATVFK
jgi:hypothetical protein